MRRCSESVNAVWLYRSTLFIIIIIIIDLCRYLLMKCVKWAGSCFYWRCRLSVLLCVSKRFFWRQCTNVLILIAILDWWQIDCWWISWYKFFSVSELLLHFRVNRACRKISRYDHTLFTILTRYANTSASGFHFAQRTITKLIVLV